ncbi:MAG: GtrA family protein [Bacteroidales bacterium]|nr:GtrA family protein [Bacteroidales bacterium]
MTLSKKQTAIQFIKYILVGCLNTAITLGVIFLCKSLLNVNPYVSNALGYIAGLINSFIWNKNWVFKSQKGYSREAIKFAVGFGICYGLQLLVVFLLNSNDFGDRQWELGTIFTISGYGVATLLGNVVYTLVNFIYNRMVTFK